MHPTADTFPNRTAPASPGPRFVCLLYHDVFPDASPGYGSLGDSATRYHISLSTFRSQLDRIHSRGLAVLPHPAMEAVSGAPTRGPDSARAIGLTFDDGWRSSVQLAAMELGRRRLPASFFITTGFLGRPHFAQADDLRRLDPGLFTIGSHGVSHRMLSSLDGVSIRQELSDSKAELEHLLGRAVTSLSIPGGAVDQRVRDIAAEVGYTAIFDSSIGVNPGRMKAGGIRRIGISRLTSAEAFDRYLGFDLRRERIRKAVLSIPKQVLGMRLYSLTRRLALGENTREQHHFQP